MCPDKTWRERSSPRVPAALTGKWIINRTLGHTVGALGGSYEHGNGKSVPEVKGSIPSGRGGACVRPGVREAPLANGCPA